MRSAPAVRALCAAICLLLPAAFAPSALAQKAQAGAKAAQQATQPAGEPAEVSGRIVAGLDKVFIKDAEGYCLTQGQDLAPFSGRMVKAKGLLIRGGEAQRTLKITSYQIQSPDDDSPGAEGLVTEPKAKAGKSKR